MRIIILGAGQVGGTLAEHLVGEANDITVVDIDAQRLARLQDRLDLRTCCGCASYPKVLEEAGARDADMLVAVTCSDEINMLACHVAQCLFGVPQKIARVRERNYLDHGAALFRGAGLAVDELISPEALVTDSLFQLLNNPGALQVINFADNRVRLIAIKARFGDALVGRSISEIKNTAVHAEFRIAAVFRHNRPVVPRGDTVIEANDEVFLITASKSLKPLLSDLQRADAPHRRVIIAGGGNIGVRLAARLENELNIKIVEHDRARCAQLSQELDNTLILNGSASDREMLVEENIGITDVFVAVTNNDETNIMASMQAKNLGVDTVITLINNPAFVDLVQGGLVDIAVSPQQSTTSALLAHVRRGDLVSVNSLRRGAAEAIEVIVHGNQQTSRVVGRCIGELDLPDSTTLGALVRGDEVLIARQDLRIEDEDHLIFFVADHRDLRKVEKLFTVSFEFI